jgi:hypothetical protein
MCPFFCQEVPLLLSGSAPSPVRKCPFSYLIFLPNLDEPESVVRKIAVKDLPSLGFAALLCEEPLL